MAPNKRCTSSSSFADEAKINSKLHRPCAEIESLTRPIYDGSPIKSPHADTDGVLT